MINLYDFLEIEPTNDVQAIELAIEEAIQQSKDEKAILLCKNYLLNSDRKKKYDAQMGIKIRKYSTPKIPQIKPQNKKLYIALIVSAVAALSLILAGVYYLPSYLAVNTAKEAASKNLIDPTSPLFRDVEYSSVSIYGEKKGFVCGEMNGKNRMGAYSGFRAFIYSIENENLIHYPDDDEIAEDLFVSSWMVACLDKGYENYFIDSDDKNGKLGWVREEFKIIKIKQEAYIVSSSEAQEESRALKDSLKPEEWKMYRALVKPAIFAH